MRFPRNHAYSIAYRRIHIMYRNIIYACVYAIFALYVLCLTYILLYLFGSKSTKQILFSSPKQENRQQKKYVYFKLRKYIYIFGIFVNQMRLRSISTLTLRQENTVYAYLDYSICLHLFFPLFDGVAVYIFCFAHYKNIFTHFINSHDPIRGRKCVHGPTHYTIYYKYSIIHHRYQNPYTQSYLEFCKNKI